jgi:hypothetical protein
MNNLIYKNAKGLALVALALQTGCIAPRIPHPLARSLGPMEQTFILPVRSEDVSVTDTFTRPNGFVFFTTNRMVRTINRVLDSMASHDNRLIGPRQTAKRLESVLPRVTFEWVQTDATELTASQMEQMRALAQRLGSSRIVAAHVAVHVEPTSNFIGEGEAQDFEVELRLWHLDPPAELARAHGHNRGWWAGGGGGSYGGAGIYIFGKGFDLALDQAMRAALTDLFQNDRRLGPIRADPQPPALILPGVPKPLSVPPTTSVEQYEEPK